MKKTLSILYFLCTSFLVCTIVDAAPVVASISGTQTAHVGERVIITISYTANSSSPVFTASGDVKYDTTALDETGVSFGSSWLPVGKPPYEVTEPGHILRTAGYPAGLSSTDRFITISFTAKKPGVTNINLTGGMALGQEDSDYGVSPRSFSINVIGDDPVKPKTKEVTPEEKTLPLKDTTQTTKTTANNTLTKAVSTAVETSIVQKESVGEKIEKIYISETGDVKIKSINLPEGEYVITIKSGSNKKEKPIFEKTVQVVKATSTETVNQDRSSAGKEESWFKKVLKFFGIAW
jgi:hypothetical protein